MSFLCSPEPRTKRSRAELLDEIDWFENEIQAINKEKNDLRNELITTKKDVTQLKAAVEQSIDLAEFERTQQQLVEQQQQAGCLRKELNRLKQDLKDREKQHTDLWDQNEKLQKQIDSTRSELQTFKIKSKEMIEHLQSMAKEYQLQKSKASQLQETNEELTSKIVVLQSEVDYFREQAKPNETMDISHLTEKSFETMDLVINIQLQEAQQRAQQSEQREIALKQQMVLQSEKFELEQKSIHSKFEQKLMDCEKKYEQQMAELQDTMKNESAAHEQEVVVLHQNFDLERQSIRTEYEKKVTELEQKHEQLEQQMTELRDTMKNESAAQEEAIAALRQNFDLERKSLQKEFDQKMLNFQISEERLMSINKDFEQQIVELKATMKNESAAHLQAISELNQSFELEKKSIYSEFDEKLTALQTNQAQLESVKSNLEQQLVTLQDKIKQESNEHKQTMADLNQNFDSERQSIRTEFEKKLSDLKKMHEQQVADLQNSKKDESAAHERAIVELTKNFDLEKEAIVAQFDEKVISFQTNQKKMENAKTELEQRIGELQVKMEQDSLSHQRAIAEFGQNFDLERKTLKDTIVEIELALQQANECHANDLEMKQNIWLSEKTSLQHKMSEYEQQLDFLRTQNDEQAQSLKSQIMECNQLNNQLQEINKNNEERLQKIMSNFEKEKSQLQSDLIDQRTQNENHLQQLFEQSVAESKRKLKECEGRLLHQFETERSEWMLQHDQKVHHLETQIKGSRQKLAQIQSEMLKKDENINQLKAENEKSAKRMDELKTEVSRCTGTCRDAVLQKQLKTEIAQYMGLLSRQSKTMKNFKQGLYMPQSAEMELLKRQLYEKDALIQRLQSDLKCSEDSLILVQSSKENMYSTFRNAVAPSLSGRTLNGLSNASSASSSVSNFESCNQGNKMPLTNSSLSRLDSMSKSNVFPSRFDLNKTGSMFKVEDEPNESMDAKKVAESEADRKARISELRSRNACYLPHLRSSYPVEFQQSVSSPTLNVQVELPDKQTKLSAPTATPKLFSVSSTAISSSASTSALNASSVHYRKRPNDEEHIQLAVAEPSFLQTSSTNQPGGLWHRKKKN